MKVWIEFSGDKDGLKITYYVNLMNRYFAASTYKRASNQKRWDLKKLLITRKLKFSPIIRSNGSVISEFTSFEIEDNKIKFDIPCPK